MSIETKEARLREIIGGLGTVLVAFSGGVDSTVVLKVALDELGRDRVLAVTAHGEVHSRAELEAACATAARLRARHRVIAAQELSTPGYAANPPERCFLCRSAMWKAMATLAEEEGCATVVEGANADDQDDYRPGLKAAALFGVRSPLIEAGLTKDEVRTLARRWGLVEADRPASPCLASRIPYGEPITSEKLRMIEAGERGLRELGFSQVRVRHRGDLASVEVEESELPRAVEDATRRAIVEHLRQVGFTYVALDLRGFRSGSLNESLVTQRGRGAAEPAEAQLVSGAEPPRAEGERA
jgi:uncharacterized protein